MKQIIALLLLLMITGCSTSRSFQFRADPVSVTPETDFHLGYFLTHVEIAAESPLIHPAEQIYQYRILGATEQGDFVNGGPRSVILVTVWDYTNHRDGNIKTFRINGTHFWKFIGVVEYKADQKGGYFLSFRIASRPTREREEIYLVKVGFESATVERQETREW